MSDAFTQRTSAADLHRICSGLGISVRVCRKSELPAAIKAFTMKKGSGNIIMNLDDYGAGSHWTAVSVPHKMYFDSYAQAPPTVVPRNYQMASQKKELESIESTDCGGLCCLWLYYIAHKGNSEYYRLFKDVYR